MDNSKGRVYQVNMSKFADESDCLRRSWGFTNDDFLDVYLRSGLDGWDVHPCRAMIRSILASHVHVDLPSRLSCLEVGCGSANEFEGLIEVGLATQLAYTGIDICPKNIENAKRRYPTADFREGDILDGSFASGSYDLVFMKDVLEHLSLEACHFALEEALRIATSGVIVAFFNEDARAGEHQISRVRLYHWNRYSRSELTKFLEACEAHAEYHDLPAELQELYPRRSVWYITRRH